MFKYIFGFSPTERLLAGLSPRRNAQLGRATAVLSAIGWAGLLREFIPAFAAGAGSWTLRSPQWLLVAAFAAILPAFFLGRALAERALAARLDTTYGRGRRWRWALAVQFWGIWAYWLVADRRLPRPSPRPREAAV